MAHKILLIESDQAFAGRISKSLEASGFEVRTAADGKEGLELARDAAPRAIVLCVELAGMSGYLVCQKLKKDDALKAIPLVLTSAEATQETFDKHRTLKARADEYLLKPYEPAALIEKLGTLVGLPEAAHLADAVVEDDELVTLEEEMEIGADAEPEAEIVGLELQLLPDEPSTGGEGSAGLDEDLRLLDDAFDGLSAPPAAKDAAAALDELTRDTPAPGGDLEAAAARRSEEADDDAALEALGEGADAALDALGAPDEAILSLDLGDERAGAPRDVSGGAREAEADAGGDGARPPGGDEQDHQDAEAAPSLRAADAEKVAAAARSQADAAQERLRTAEADARAGRDEARRAEERARTAEAEASELRRKLSEAEQRAAEAEADARRSAGEAAAGVEATRKLEALERELDDLRTELLVARGEAEGLRGELESRTAELRKRAGELEAANAKNEERVVKAYQKIKADEKIREKVRKALAIATQLLDEGIPAESPAEKERRAAALLGRE